MSKPMLARLVLPPARPLQPKADDHEDAGAKAAYAFSSAAVAEMPRLSPPEAANDAPLAGVHKVVEYAPAQGGYLR